MGSGDLQLPERGEERIREARRAAYRHECGYQHHTVASLIIFFWLHKVETFPDDP